MRFDYHGFHQELIAGRIRTTDVRWACDLLSGLTGPQWHDAFRAGGWDEAIARRYIAALQRRISQGRMLEPAPVD